MGRMEFSLAASAPEKNGCKIAWEPSKRAVRGQIEPRRRSSNGARGFGRIRKCSGGQFQPIASIRGTAMFERYTEKARRVIFFARYEASQFGSPYIETEHLLLGLLREDKALTNRF